MSGTAAPAKGSEPPTEPPAESPAAVVRLTDSVKGRARLLRPQLRLAADPNRRPPALPRNH